MDWIVVPCSKSVPLLIDSSSHKRKLKEKSHECEVRMKFHTVSTQLLLLYFCWHKRFVERWICYKTPLPSRTTCVDHTRVFLAFNSIIVQPLFNYSSRIIV